MDIFNYLWDYLYESYIATDASLKYSNLGLEKNPFISPLLILIAIFAGALIAVIVALYNKRYIGEVARKIIQSGANSPENAKTLDEFGLGKSLLAGHALCKNIVLRRFAKCVEEEDFYREQNRLREEHEQSGNGKKFKETTYPIYAKTAHFYIPEESRIKAEIRFEKKGSGWGSAVFSILIICIVFVVLLFTLPLLLEKLNDVIGSFKK